MATEFDTEQRYRVLLVLWCALFVTLGFYLMLGELSVPPSTSELGGSDRTLAIVLIVISFSMVAVSFVMKRILLKQSVERQSPAQVQSAMIVGQALCEVAALLGLSLRFVMHFDKFYWLILLA